jgi:hypothetical protein
LSLSTRSARTLPRTYVTCSGSARSLCSSLWSQPLSPKVNVRVLQQLREDNTRAAFLWVSRAYGNGHNKEVVSGKLDDAEAALFLDAYLEQVTDGARRAACNGSDTNSKTSVIHFSSGSRRLERTTLELIVSFTMLSTEHLEPLTRHCCPIWH